MRQVEEGQARSAPSLSTHSGVVPAKAGTHNHGPLEYGPLLLRGPQCLRCCVSVISAVVAVLVVLAFAAPGLAQQYPSRVVTLIVPSPAGGPTDQLARVLAPALSDKLGQNFIVENVSGGATTIATRRVARAAPGGDTLRRHNLHISADLSLYRSLPF